MMSTASSGDTASISVRHHHEAFAPDGNGRRRPYCPMHARESYQACANRELPLSLLPNLKKRYAARSRSAIRWSYVTGAMGSPCFTRYLRKGIIASAMKPSSELAHW